MSKIRIGLIGFGSWTKNAYLPALQNNNHAVITAVTALTEKTRQYAHEVLGDEVTVFDNYETLLSQAEIDAVMVAVPDKMHQAVLYAAINADIPVFYEPPIADTRHKMQFMMEELFTAPLTFANLELGYHPVIDRAIHLINAKTIGLLHNVTITLHADWGVQGDSDICLMNRMSAWYVDVLNRIIGSIPKRVLVLDGYGNSGRTQSISTGIFDYNGIWGVFKANVYSPEGLSLNIEITGDKGDIYIDFFTGELKIRSLEHPDWTVEFVTPLKPYASWPGVHESISTFIDAVINKEPHHGNAREVIKLNQIGLAMDESKDSGNWVTII
jgi:predicted dehydrogenase